MSSPDDAALHAAVAVAVPVRRLFTYRVAARWRSLVSVGARVRVPLGSRKVPGTVVIWPAPAPDPQIEIREIDSVLPDGPRLVPALLELTRFVSEYYLCSWGEAIEAALPPEVRPPLRRAVRLRLPADTAALPDRAPARRRLLERLPADGSSVPISDLTASERRSLRALALAGLVEQVTEAVIPPPPRPVPTPPRPVPTTGQAAVLDTILPEVGRRAYSPFLLFGATGSGKTEVYLRAAEAALSAGRGVLYLVPEIGLTPLLVGRLLARFEGKVALLHSGLAAGERRGAWDRVHDGKCPFVVGTRSAVFAPVADLGLVVVDEEQDPSYKQGETPRYNGRDLAVVRARAEGSVLLLGSATPSLESFQHARSGRYTLLRLGGRVLARPLPEVTIVDMRHEFAETRSTKPLSRALLEELAACLGRGEQAIVLRNRRGWAAALLCPVCGERVACSRCSLSMTWHEGAGRLRCHMCDLERPHPGVCPRCRSPHLRFLGEGTERVEHELREAFPGIRLARMDRDTVRRKGAQESLLRQFDRGELDLLVGTQMLAKGHDFPGVTLVGVLSADHALGLPDFRAGERTFQLLTQVAGRAGRGRRPGVVIVQAFDPGHPVLREAAAHDFEAFFAREIVYRRALRYPPTTALVQILVVDRDEGRAAHWAGIAVDALRVESQGRLLLSGPGPAPMERVRELHRQQILVRSVGRRRLVEAVDRALASLEGQVPRRALLVDVDPLSLM